MIDKETQLSRGLVVRHDEGLRYRVDDVRTSTVNYEEAHRLGGMMVSYTQMDEGTYPIGARWSKDEEGFRQHFTVEPKQPSKYFGTKFREAIFMIRSARSQRKLKF